jgi:hypothetical protein
VLLCHLRRNHCGWTLITLTLCLIFGSLTINLCSKTEMVSLVFYNVQSVPITIEVVSLNPSHGEVYLIQHYVIKFVSDLRQVWFSPGTPVSSTNKTDRFAIAEILLKVALNTITLTNIVQGVDIYKQSKPCYNQQFNNSSLKLLS